MTLRPLTCAVLLVLALATAPPTLADHGGGGGGGKGGGGGQVRTAGTCGHGATSALKLKRDDGRIEVEFEVDHNRSGESWRVVLVRDGSVVWTGRVRTHAPSGSFETSRRISDLSGADRVTARATGPRGITCVATAVLSG